MADTTYIQKNKRLHFEWLSQIVFQPRKAYSQIATFTYPIWLTPLLILSIIVLINVLVIGNLKNKAAQMGEITYPPDFQYYTPEQQAQFTQAVQSTQGPVFTYVLPALSSLIGAWMGWLILGGILHLVTTLIGGRGSTVLSLNIVAWATIPLAIRKLVQIIFMLITKQMISTPGLSGFSLTSSAGGALFINQILKLIDIYLLWQVLLITLGVVISMGLTKVKASSSAIISVLIMLLLQAGIAYLLTILGGLEITRPFFF